MCFRDSFSVSLKVLVGPEKTEFYIPKGLICGKSKFFKAACNEEWESGKTNTVTLEDDDPKLFSIFLTWVVTGDPSICVEWIQVS